MMSLESIDRHLADTRSAFDSVAADYDGPSGNNEIVQLMRAALLREVTRLFPSPARLLDLGCGTGIDAAFLAASGHDVTAIDWSPAMVERSETRFEAQRVAPRARGMIVGIQELDRLAPGRFDGAYSDLGAMNCVPDLAAVSRQCARLLPTGGHLIVSVMGRACPWELAFFILRRDIKGAQRRFSDDVVPVGLGDHLVWTRYYRPKEFHELWSSEFELVHYRALGLALPPPYLVGVYRRLGRAGPVLDQIDGLVGGIPGLRDLGDHFLMVLTKR